MKKAIYTLMMCACIALALNSCKDKDDEKISISSEDASDIIVNSMETEEWGIASQLLQSALMTEPLLDTANCGLQGDSSFNKHYGGSSIQYNYDFNWNWTINCLGPELSTVDINYSSTGNNSTSEMSSTFTCSGDFAMSALDTASHEFIFNGAYTRDGDFSSKVSPSHVCNIHMVITFSNVHMSKADHNYTSGTANAALTCTTADSEVFDFSGTIVFNGNQNCTLTLDGKGYTIQL
jgi:hypothetical protein